MFNVDNYDMNSILITHDGIIYTLKIRCSHVLVIVRLVHLLHNVTEYQSLNYPVLFYQSINQKWLRTTNITENYLTNGPHTVILPFMKLLRMLSI